MAGPASYRKTKKRLQRVGMRPSRGLNRPHSGQHRGKPKAAREDARQTYQRNPAPRSASRWSSASIRAVIKRQQAENRRMLAEWKASARTPQEKASVVDELKDSRKRMAADLLRLRKELNEQRRRGNGKKARRVNAASSTGKMIPAKVRVSKDGTVRVFVNPKYLPQLGDRQ